jgi:hypothetical protein
VIKRVPLPIVMQPIAIQDVGNQWRRRRAVPPKG